MFIHWTILTGAIIASLLPTVTPSITVSSPKAQTLPPITLPITVFSSTPKYSPSTTINTTSNSPPEGKPAATEYETKTAIPSDNVPIVIADSTTAFPVDNAEPAVTISSSLSAPYNVSFKATTNKTVNNAAADFIDRVTENVPYSVKPSTTENMIDTEGPVHKVTTKLPWTKWSQKRVKLNLTSVRLPVLSITDPFSTTSPRSVAASGKSLLHMLSTAKSAIPEDVEWVPMDAMERNGQTSNSTREASVGLPMVRDFIFRVKSSFANPSGVGSRADPETEMPSPKPANVAFVTKLRNPNRRPALLDATQRPMASITFVTPSPASNGQKESSTLTEKLFIGSGEASEPPTTIIRLKHKPSTGSHLFIAAGEGPMISKTRIINSTSTLFPYVTSSNTSTAFLLNQRHKSSTPLPVSKTTQRATGVVPSTTNKLGPQQNLTSGSQHAAAEGITIAASEINRTNGQQSKSKFNSASDKIWIPVAVSTPPPRTRPVSSSNQMIVKTPSRNKVTKRPIIKTSTSKSANGTNISLKYKDSYDTSYFDRLADPLSEALLSSDIMYANSDSFGDNSVYAHTTVQAPPGYEHTTQGYVTLAWNNDYGPTTPSKIVSTTYSSSAHPILVSALANGPDFTIYEDEIHDKPTFPQGPEYDGEYVHSEAPPHAQQKPSTSEEVLFNKYPNSSPNAYTTLKTLYSPAYTTASTSGYSSMYQTGKPVFSNNPNKSPLNTYQTTKPNYGNSYRPPTVSLTYQTTPGYVSSHETNKLPQNGAYDSMKPSYTPYQTTKAPYGNAHYGTNKPTYGNEFKPTRAPYGNSYETTKPAYSNSYQPTQPAYGNSYVTAKPSYDNTYKSTTISYGNAYGPTTEVYGNEYESKKPYAATYQEERPMPSTSYQPEKPAYAGMYESQPVQPSSQNYAESDNYQASKPSYGNNGANNQQNPSYYGQDGGTGGQQSSYSSETHSPPNYNKKPAITPQPNYGVNKGQQGPDYHGYGDNKHSNAPPQTAYTTVPSTYYVSGTTVSSYEGIPSYQKGAIVGGPPPPYYMGEVPAPSLQPPVYYPSTTPAPYTTQPYSPQPTYANKPYNGQDPHYSTTPYYKPQIQPSYYADGKPAASTYEGSGQPNSNGNKKPPVSVYEGEQDHYQPGNYAQNVKPQYGDTGAGPYPPENYAGSAKPQYSDGGASPYPPENYAGSAKPQYSDGGASPYPPENYAGSAKPQYSDGGASPYPPENYAGSAKPQYADGGSTLYPPDSYDGNNKTPYNDGSSNTYTNYAGGDKPPHNNGGSYQHPSENSAHSPSADSASSDDGATSNQPYFVADEEFGLDADELLAILLARANKTELDFDDQPSFTIHNSTVLRPATQPASSAAANLRPFSTGTGNIIALLASLTSTTEPPMGPPLQQADDDAETVNEESGGSDNSGGSNGTLQRLLLAIGMSVIPTATIAVLVGFPALLIGRRRRDLGDGNNKERVAQLIEEVNASMEKYVSSLPEKLTTEDGNDLRELCAETLEEAETNQNGRPTDWLRMRKPKNHDGLSWKKIFNHVRNFLPRLKFGIQKNGTASENDETQNIIGEHTNGSGIVFIPVNAEDIVSTWNKPSRAKRPGNAMKSKLNATSSSEERPTPSKFPAGIHKHFQELICSKIMSLLEDDDDELDSELEDVYGDNLVTDKEVLGKEYSLVSNTTDVINTTLPLLTHVASFVLPDVQSATRVFQPEVITGLVQNNYTSINNLIISSNVSKLKETTTENSENKSSGKDQIFGDMQKGHSQVEKDKEEIYNQVSELKDASGERGKTMQMGYTDVTAPVRNAVGSYDGVPPIKFIINAKDDDDTSTKPRGPLAVIIVYDENNYTVSYLDRRLMKKKHLSMQLKTINNKHPITNTNKIPTKVEIIQNDEREIDKSNRYEEIMLLGMQPLSTAGLESDSSRDTIKYNPKMAPKKSLTNEASKSTQRPNTRFFINERKRLLQTSKPTDLKMLPELDLNNNWKELNRILTMLSKASFNTSSEDNSVQNSIEATSRETSTKAQYNALKDQSKQASVSKSRNDQYWAARPRRDVSKSNTVLSNFDKEYMRNNSAKVPKMLKRRYLKKSNNTAKHSKLSRTNSTKSLKNADFKLLESQRSNSVSSLLPLPKIPGNIHEGKLYIYHLLMSPKPSSEHLTTPADLSENSAHRITIAKKPPVTENNKHDSPSQSQVSDSWPRTTTVYPRTSSTAAPVITTVSSNARAASDNSTSFNNSTKDIRSVHPTLLSSFGLVPHPPLRPVPSVFSIPIQVENSTPEYMHIIGSPISWPLSPHLPQSHYPPYVQPVKTTTSTTTTTPQPYPNWFFPGWGNWHYLNSQLRPNFPNVYPNPAVPTNGVWYTTNASTSDPNTKATAIVSNVAHPVPTNSSSSVAVSPTTINIYTIHGISSDLLPFVQNPVTTPKRVGDDGYQTVSTAFPTISQDYYDDYYDEDAEYNFQPAAPPVITTRRPPHPPQPTNRPPPNRRPTTRKPFRPRPTPSTEVFDDPPFIEGTTKRIRPANIRPRPVPQVCVDCQTTSSPGVGFNGQAITQGPQGLKTTPATKASFFDVLNQKLGLNAKGGLLPLLELGNLGLLGAWDPWGRPNTAEEWWPGDKRSMDSNKTKGDRAAQKPFIGVSVPNQSNGNLKKRRQRPPNPFRANPRFRKMLDRISSSLHNGSSSLSSGQANRVNEAVPELEAKNSSRRWKNSRRWFQRVRHFLRNRTSNSSRRLQAQNGGMAEHNNTSSLQNIQLGRSPPIRQKHQRRRYRPRERTLHLSNSLNLTIAEQKEASEINRNNTDDLTAMSNSFNETDQFKIS